MHVSEHSKPNSGGRLHASPPSEPARRAALEERASATTHITVGFDAAFEAENQNASARAAAPAMARWAPPKPVSAPKKGRLGQLVRISFAVGVLAVGGAFMYDRFVGVSSGTAVLSGVLMVVRTPIDGQFTAVVPLEPGAIVEAGQRIGVIDNERSDTGRLIDFKAAAAALDGEIESLLLRIDATDATMKAAAANADAFRQARVDQLTARLRETEAGVAAGRARVRESEAALERSEALLASRSGTAVSAEQARRVYAVAVSDLQVAVQRRAAAQTELDAARAGVFATDVASDRSASQQSIDRLRLLRGELAAQLAERGHRLDVLKKQIEAEQARTERFAHAVMRVDNRSRVVHQHAQSGEFLRQGQMVAEFTDCGRPVVISAVDENKFRSLKLGMTGTFTAGEMLSQLGRGTPSYEGTVVQLLTPLTTPQMMGNDTKHRAVLQLRSEALVQACEIGQMGRVTFG